jgi:hypothetical protein
MSVETEAAAAGGGWAFVSSATASTSSSLDFTNMVDGYDYLYSCESVLPATDSTNCKGLLGVSGPTYRTSSYKESSSQSGGASVTADDRCSIGPDSGNSELGNGTDEGIRLCEFILSNPANASSKTVWLAVSAWQNGSSTMKNGFGGGVYTTAEAHVALRFIMVSGNITSGLIMQYRRSRS